MTYKEKIKKLSSLEKFINGKYQDEIILVLDKKYKDDKWGLICAIMHWFNVVSPYLNSTKVLRKNTKDYNWGNVYLYICSVDIVTKGIDDLYKMIEKTDIHIFHGENNIFNNPDKDDIGYFADIRAVFGAHPTNLDGHGDFFVATYPTPYNWNLDQLRGVSKNWDYYTLLWSKKKSSDLLQKEFGFSFYEVDKYLDKYIEYLDIFYLKIKEMINDYYNKISQKPINKIKDISKQIDLLIIEDEKRFNKKYNYELNILLTLINIKINDDYNEKLYSLFRDKLISLIPKVYQVIQNPLKHKSLIFLDKLLFCNNINYDNNTSYYYSKLLEYNNNIDMEKLLINYYDSKISPFNSNIETIEELFCIIKAYNYFIYHSI